jgi:hypothetical protein
VLGSAPTVAVREPPFGPQIVMLGSCLTTSVAWWKSYPVAQELCRTSRQSWQASTKPCVPATRIMFSTLVRKFLFQFHLEMSFQGCPRHQDWRRLVSRSVPPSTGFVAPFTVLCDPAVDVFFAAAVIFEGYSIFPHLYVVIS